MPTINEDILDLSAEDLEGFHAVVPLVALSNDPIVSLRQNWTEEIKHQSSVRLAELAKSAGVRRFLFSPSCILYGMSSAEVVNEESPLDPQTEYARSKFKRAGHLSARRCWICSCFFEERNDLRPVTAYALRHGVQRSDGLCGNDGQGD